MKKTPPTWVGVLSMRWHFALLVVLLFVLVLGGAI